MATEQTQTVNVWVAGYSPSETKTYDWAGYGVIYEPNQQEENYAEYGRLEKTTDTTNFIAEYEALIHALRGVETKVSVSKGGRINAYTALETIAGQVNAGWDTETHLRGYRDEVQKQLSELEDASLSFEHRESGRLEDALDWAQEAAQSESASWEGNNDE